MDNQGKLLGFIATAKGAKIIYTDNIVEQDELTYKKLTVEVERKPSNNLILALRTLLTHALLKCELTEGKIKEKEVNSRKAVDMPAFKGFSIDSFSIKGDGEDEKLSIKMTKVTSAGDSFTIAVPDILIVDNNNPYENQLAEDLDNLITECNNFREGKNYFIQGDLFKEKVSAGKEDEEDEKL